DEPFFLLEPPDAEDRSVEALQERSGGQHVWGKSRSRREGVGEDRLQPVERGAEAAGVRRKRGQVVEANALLKPVGARERHRRLSRELASQAAAEIVRQLP